MSLAGNPFPPSPVQPALLDGSRTIQFRCRKGITCWNACCSNIDIALTPYDILRLKSRFGISSFDFLVQYTVPYEMERDGIAGVKLKSVEGGTACRFMTPEGCSVYTDRPTACRYYPVALLAMRRQDEATDRSAYALVKEAHCLGHEEPRKLTIDAYREEQGLPEYDELAHGWRQLILKKRSSGPTVGTPSRRSLELFFMTCYDLDRFRAFVASEGFGAIYDVPEAELDAILGNDTMLMLFGFRFLRQVLFGEETIPVREAAVDERRAQLAEKRRRLEQDPAVRTAERGDGPATARP